MKVTLVNCLWEELVSKDIHLYRYLLNYQTGPAVICINMDTAVGGCRLVQVKDVVKYATICST